VICYQVKERHFSKSNDLYQRELIKEGRKSDEDLVMVMNNYCDVVTSGDHTSFPRDAASWKCALCQKSNLLSVDACRDCFTSRTGRVANDYAYPDLRSGVYDGSGHSYHLRNMMSDNISVGYPAVIDSRYWNNSSVAATPAVAAADRFNNNWHGNGPLSNNQQEGLVFRECHHCKVIISVKVGDLCTECTAKHLNYMRNKRDTPSSTEPSQEQHSVTGKRTSFTKEDEERKRKEIEETVRRYKEKRTKEEREIEITANLEDRRKRRVTVSYKCDDCFTVDSDHHRPSSCSMCNSNRFQETEEEISSTLSSSSIGMVGDVVQTVSGMFGGFVSVANNVVNALVTANPEELMMHHTDEGVE
jgi:hypothetical protein